jgi:hypothetical protein
MATLPIDVPAGGITNVMIAAGAGINASKIIRHQSIDKEPADLATTVTAGSKALHIVRGAQGVAVAFQAAITGAAISGAYTFTVDLQKSTSGGAYASILSAPLTFNSSSTLRQYYGATISNGSLIQGDILIAVVTVSGGSGTQAQGLQVTLTMEETEV